MKKIPYPLFLLLCFVAALAIGCTKDTDNDKQDDIVAQARADRNLAAEYDRQWKMRLAEIYYKKAYDALSDNPEKDWKCYGHSGYAYAYMLYNRGEREQAMTVLSDILSKAENNKEFPAVTMSGAIQMMAACQMGLGMTKEAKQNYIRSYEIMLEATGGEGKGDINVVITCISTYESLMALGDIEEAEEWLRRGEEELRIYEQKTTPRS